MPWQESAAGKRRRSERLTRTDGVNEDAAFHKAQSERDDGDSSEKWLDDVLLNHQDEIDEVIARHSRKKAAANGSAQFVSAQDLMSDMQLGPGVGLGDGAGGQPPRHHASVFEDPPFNLPPAFADVYHKRGITRPYQWQIDMLSNGTHGLDGTSAGRGVKRCNFVYSLPTSGGKSLVGDILLLQRMLESSLDPTHPNKAMLIVPYVSLVAEKVAGLMEFMRVSPVPFSVEQMSGNSPIDILTIGPQIYVATIEKGASVVDHLLTQGRIHELAVVVVDELQFLGEPNRGAELEMLLTKVRFFSEMTQIVGMSATVPNLQQIADWLGATAIVETFRPVQLREFVVTCNNGANASDADVDITEYLGVRGIESGVHARRCETLKRKLPIDTQAAGSSTGGSFDPSKLSHQSSFGRGDSGFVAPIVSRLCVEAAAQGQILVFCPTKSATEGYALAIANAITSTVPNNTASEVIAERQLLVDSLKEVTGMVHDSRLAKTVMDGVAFHHAGLTSDEKSMIEEAYRAGVIRVITCTSTLAAGVNLPVRRVIIATNRLGSEPLKVGRYTQMTGRAGRAGLTDAGESFLVIPTSEIDSARYLLTGPHEPIMSDLENRLENVLLGAVCAQQDLLLRESRHGCSDGDAGEPMSVNEDWVRSFSASTFWACQRRPKQQLDANQNWNAREPEQQFEEVVAQALAKLQDQGFLQFHAQSDMYMGTDMKMWPLISTAAVGGTDSTDGAGGVVVDGASQSGRQSAQHSHRRLVATKFGIAASMGGFRHLHEAVSVKIDIDRSLHEVLLDDICQSQCPLYLIWMQTPYSESTLKSSHFKVLLEIFQHQQDGGQLLQQRYGLKPGYITKNVWATVDTRVTANDQCGRSHLRYFQALILKEIVLEIPLRDIANKFDVTLDALESLMETTSRFSSHVAIFCERMGIWPLRHLFGIFSRRLWVGVKEDIVHLTTIEGVKAKRARALWNAEYRTIEQIARADPIVLCQRIQRTLGPRPEGVARNIVEAARQAVARKRAEAEEALKALEM